MCIWAYGIFGVLIISLWHFRCSYYKSLAIKVFSYVLRVLALAFDA